MRTKPLVGSFSHRESWV